MSSIGLAVDLDAERLGAGATTSQRLRMRRAGERDARALVAVMADSAMPTASATAVASSSSEAEATGRPVSSVDQRLEIEQHFQPALADLGLVGRVGRVPGRVLEQVALDDRRHDGAVIAGADEALQHRVRRHLRRQVRPAPQLRVAGAGRVERAVEADRFRHGLARSASRATARRARPAWRGCRSRLGPIWRAAKRIGCCVIVMIRVSRYGPCSRPRPAGRRAGPRRRASSSTASRRRSRPS